MAVWIPNWDLNCIKCSDGQKEFNGCEQDSSIPERWKIREWTWQRCPVKLITNKTHQLMWAYRLFQLGRTPYGRGWLQESNKYMEAMRVIDQEIQRIETENLRQMKKTKP